MPAAGLHLLKGVKPLSRDKYFRTLGTSPHDSIESSSLIAHCLYCIFVDLGDNTLVEELDSQPILTDRMSSHAGLQLW